MRQQFIVIVDGNKMNARQGAEQQKLLAIVSGELPQDVNSHVLHKCMSAGIGQMEYIYMF